jgi:hypothetical protein
VFAFMLCTHVAHRKQATIEEHEDSEHGEEQSGGGEADANFPVVVQAEVGHCGARAVAVCG